MIKNDNNIGSNFCNNQKLGVEKIPYELAKRMGIAIVDHSSAANTVEVLCADPSDVSISDKLRSFIKREFSCKKADREKIEKNLANNYPYKEVMGYLLEKVKQEEIVDGGYVDSCAHISGENSKLIELVDFIIDRAIVEKASDIHFEPERDYLRVRYRVDGILTEKAIIDYDIWKKINIRLKVLAKMSLAEHRKCFMGKIVHNFCGREIDIRISSQPVNWGENMVLRILDTKEKHIRFDNIGFDDEIKKLFIEGFSRSSGLFLISGPTGSGKTTTLYSILEEINSVEKNIVTLEDPIEYNMPLVRQTQIDYFGNVSFADGVRSILRQDPDIILIGEIRDEETAHMAVRAAMTGHLVFSTIHARDSKSIALRLRDFGVSDYLIEENLVACASQRLVRKLCNNCKRERTINDHEKYLFNLYGFSDVPLVVGQEVGCSRCGGTGFSGRHIIAEVLLSWKGMSESMAKKSLRLVSANITTVNEIKRVLDL